ncbi:cyclin-like protein [Rozella allomycis CSF55]|uniref:Transcription initiation factor IIB n=1 Tax=Rozella allomycis (strain CSF55) TaxID=988480 RepID=A0A075AQZ5_ROZAC|nr:Cyclin-like domain-containing protein [Rozella allomycis CSF55]RKP21981.1 cyclin-like protein [Rozella allomycis CSF55]|eukprot:EPZ32711.1 Cyclin-like domain-containing protein [Rozella allomycis CSF55]
MERSKKSNNLRVICPDCRNPHPNIVEDFKSGTLICRDCAVVLVDRIIDTRSEWRTFSSEAGKDDPSRVGGASDPLLNGTQLDTMISAQDGFSGMSKELNRVQQRTAMSSSNRALINAAKDIATHCDRMNLPKVVIDRARQYFQIAEKHKLLKSKSANGMIAACILIACAQEGVARTYKEICAITRVPKVEIARCKKALLEHLTVAPKVGKASDFVARQCNALGMGADMERLGTEIVKRASDHGCVDGKSPLSVSAAGIYILTLLYQKYRGIMKNISEVAGVSEMTIRNTYRDMYPHLDTIIPDTVPKELVQMLPSP